MDKQYLAKALDDIIDTYKSEATQYTSCYLDENVLYAFDHLYNAQLHALESIRQLIINSDFVD